jgi:hypothetical protein
MTFFSKSLALAFTGLLSGMLCPALRAQQPVERPAAGAAAPATPRAFDFTHLKDRPYTFALPKPSYPSSERVQREFVVEYLYDYAVSNYTPEVELPIIPVAQFQRDTPEHALVAFFTTMRTGDYDNWIKCWDDRDRNALMALAKDKKQDAAFWQNVWRPAFTRSKTVVLVDRLETASQYVILDVRLPGLSVPALPTAFKLVNGEWQATNDLTNDPILFQFRPSLAGTITYVPPMDTSTLDKQYTAQAQAQQHFLHEHGVRSKVVEAGQTGTNNLPNPVSKPANPAAAK